MRAISIEVGDTPETLEVCADYAGPGSPGEEITLDCSEERSGRYVKILGPGDNENSCFDVLPILQMCEVRVLGYSTAMN